MKVTLMLILMIATWSRGDIFIDRVAYLIDCKITRPLEFDQCKRKVLKDGMSQRDLNLALKDVENATK